MQKVLQTVYKGHSIKAVNTWFEGFSLFLDDKLIAHEKKNLHLDRDVPFISIVIKTHDGEEKLDVFVEAVITIKILLQVNGVTIARSDHAAA